MSKADLTAPRLGAFVPGHIATFDVSWTFATIALAVVATGLPVVTHLAGQAFGIATCFALALLIANFAAPAVPIVLIFSYLFQNFFVALVSPQIGDINEFNAARGYNFILTAAVWIVVAGSYWLGRASVDARLRSVINVTTVALIFVGLYFGIGLLRDPGGAIVYLRNIAAPLLLFQIVVLVAYRYRVSVTSALVLIATAALVFGYFELLAQDKLFPLINADAYLKWRIMQEYKSGAWLKEMQETGRVYRSYLDALVSFAYALAIFSILLFAIGHRWFAVLTLPALLVIGSKGALLLVIFVTGALVAIRWFRGFGALWAYTALLLAYAAAGIVMGIRSEDYHVFGFIGGLNGFMKNPLGHGIGSGGNLSLNMAGVDWSRAQHLGSTDVAVESAIGVLLYQMGIFGIVVLASVGLIAVRLWKLYIGTHERVFGVAALGLLTILVNGIFQEEALFAPLALGLLLAVAGLLLGRAYRVAAAPGIAAGRSS